MLASGMPVAGWPMHHPLALLRAGCVWGPGLPEATVVPAAGGGAGEGAEGERGAEDKQVKGGRARLLGGPSRCSQRCGDAGRVT